MPSRFDPDPDPKNPPDESKVDISKRYDVYCMQHGAGGLVVYRRHSLLFRFPVFIGLQGSAALFGSLGGPGYAYRRGLLYPGLGNAVFGGF